MTQTIYMFYIFNVRQVSPLIFISIQLNYLAFAQPSDRNTFTLPNGFSVSSTLSICHNLSRLFHQVQIELNISAIQHPLIAPYFFTTVFSQTFKAWKRHLQLLFCRCKEMPSVEGYMGSNSDSVSSQLSVLNFSICQCFNSCIYKTGT